MPNYKGKPVALLSEVLPGKQRATAASKPQNRSARESEFGEEGFANPVALGSDSPNSSRALPSSMLSIDAARSQAGVTYFNGGCACTV